MNNTYTKPFVTALVASALFMSATAQPGFPGGGEPPQNGGPEGMPGFGVPPGFGQNGPGSPGGGGGQQEIKLVSKFDTNSDGWLNLEERKAARKSLKQQQGTRPTGGGPQGFGPRGQNRVATKAGVKLTPADVKNFHDAPLYDPAAIRTFFIEFEAADWEQELADFKYTDVDVPAKVTVDGVVYPDVGVHFHGMSSYMMVGEGQKRSLVLTFDYIKPKQSLNGYTKINLLNSHEDASFLRTVLAMHIARQYLPAPKAGFSKVAINGESWGLYVNQQHFNKEFIREWYPSAKGARWKTPGSPNGYAGFNYLGDNAAAYKTIYEIKSKDEASAWTDLIHLCKLLQDTPAEQLENTLSPVLDIDGILRYFAWDNVLANGDGFWTRACDYSLYEDPSGRFHLFPYDANETFSNGGGPGGPGGMEQGGPRGMGQGGPGGMGQGGMGRGGPGMMMAQGGAELNPLISTNDTSKPLISKLLAVPALRAKYLGYVRSMAENWLDWNKLGPVAQQYQTQITDDVKADTRKLSTTEDFLKALAPASESNNRTESIRAFVEKRRAYLLGLPAVKDAALPK
jgi:spore coat protein CotH